MILYMTVTTVTVTVITSCNIEKGIEDSRTIMSYNIITIY